MPEVASLKAVLSANTNQFEQAMSRSQRRMEETTRASKRLMTSVGLMAGAMTGLGIAAVRLAGKMEQSRMGFETMLGSAQKADRFLRDLANFAAKTPFEFFELQSAARRMMAYGFAAEQVIPTLRILGDATAALGGSSEMIDRVTVALGQMQAKGVVSAQEIRQLAEAGIPAWEFLADAIGVSIPEAMKLAESRAIASSDAIPAILAGMNDKFSGLMARMQDSVVGKWSNMIDQLTLTGIAFGEDLVETFHLKEVITAATGALESLRQVFEEKGLKGIWAEQKEGVELLAGAIMGMLAPAVLNAALAFGRMALVLAPWAAAGVLVVKIAGDMGVTLDQVVAAAGRVARVFEGLYKITLAIANGVAAFIRGIITGLHEWVMTLAGAGDKLAEAVRNPLQAREILSGLGEDLRQLEVNGLADSIEAEFGRAWSLMQEGGRDVKAAILGTMDDTQEGIEGNLQGIVSSVEGAVRGLMPSLDDLSEGFAGVGEGAAAAVDVAVSSFDRLGERIRQFQQAQAQSAFLQGGNTVGDAGSPRAIPIPGVTGSAGAARGIPVPAARALVSGAVSVVLTPLVNFNRAMAQRMMARQDRINNQVRFGSPEALQAYTNQARAKHGAISGPVAIPVPGVSASAGGLTAIPVPGVSGSAGRSRAIPIPGVTASAGEALPIPVPGVSSGRRDRRSLPGEAYEQALRNEIEHRQKLIEKLTVVSADDGPLSAFGKTLLDVASQQIPALGAALQGFTQAGPIGAVAAIFGEMLKVMEPFQKLMEVLNKAFAKVAEVVGQVLAPVFNLIGMVVTHVVNALVEVYNFLLGWLLGRVETLGEEAPKAPEPPKGAAFGVGRSDPSYNPQVALSVGRSNASPAMSSALINVADLFGVHVDSFGAAVDKFVSGSSRFARTNGGL